MSTFLNLVSCVGVTVVVVLAVIGAVTIYRVGRNREQREFDLRARRAEQEIINMGRRAQETILREALRRASETSTIGNSSADRSS